jgi:hypothetical protein
MVLAKVVSSGTYVIITIVAKVHLLRITRTKRTIRLCAIKYTLEAETYRQTDITLIPCFYLMRLLHTAPGHCRNSVQQLHESFSNVVAPVFSLRRQN